MARLSRSAMLIRNAVPPFSPTSIAAISRSLRPFRQMRHPRADRKSVRYRRPWSRRVRRAYCVRLYNNRALPSAIYDFEPHRALVR